MAYSNGTFSLYTPGNPVVTGTTIASTWANNTLSEIATALTFLGRSVETGITAAGTTQSDAITATKYLNVISTAASGTGIKLTLSAVGAEQVVYNGGANPVKVYPGVNNNFNDLAADTGFILPTKTAVKCFAVTSTRWIAMLSA